MTERAETPAANRPPRLIASLRALPTPVWILFIGTFINRFGSFVMPFLAIYFTHEGYDLRHTGIAVGAYGAGHLFASLLGGHLADRIGRRNTIVLSMFSSAIAMMLLSQAHGFLAIVLLTCLAGSAAELYRPASHALIGDLVAVDQRTNAFAFYRFAVNLGFAAGPATAGFLAQRSFSYIFIGDALTSLAYGALALVALPNGIRQRDRQERFGEAFLDATKNRRFVFLIFASICMTLVDYQSTSTFPLHIQAMGFPASTYGLLLALNGVMIILFELAITSFTQRFRPRHAIAAGYLLCGIGFALTGRAHTLLALAGTVVLWTIGEMLSSPVVGGYALTLAPEPYRGRYMGLLVLTWSIGMTVGPWVGTQLFATAPSMLWVACGVLGVVSAVLALES